MSLREGGEKICFVNVKQTYEHLFVYNSQLSITFQHFTQASERDNSKGGRISTFEAWNGENAFSEGGKKNFRGETLK